MSATNNGTFIGRIVNQPELYEGENFKATSFRVAENTKYKGETKTVFMEFSAWNGTAETICKYFKKGDPIILTYELENRPVSKDSNIQTVRGRVTGFSFVPGNKKSDNSDDTVENTSTKTEVDLVDDGDQDEELPF